MPLAGDAHRPSWRAWALAVLTAGLLVAAMTRPMLGQLTTVGRLDTNDGRFSIWNIGWIGHALLTDPQHLLDANIFWPHTGTLAYSELNLVAGLFGLPWYAATGSALAALNGAVFIALTLAFVCTWALVVRLTGSLPAGYVAGAAFTFSPFVSARTPHIQLLMVFAYPLLLLALHRLRDRPTVGSGLVLGGALAVAALSCGYYGIYGGCAVGLVGLALATRRRAYWGALAVAAVASAIFLAPVFYAFSSARAASGAEIVARSGEAGGWSANASAWLASGAAAHAWWLPALQQWMPWNEVLFPGVLTVVLVAAGGIRATRTVGPRIVMAYVALAAASFWASFGPDAGLYRLIELVVPGTDLLRAPARFGSVTVFALAVLAGLATSTLCTRRTWLGPLLTIAILAELAVWTPEWGWPSWPLRETHPVSPAYRTLARLPRAPLVEYPFPYERSNYHNHGHALFWSTYHWQPLVNGYSDVIPPDFDAIARPINAFPDAASFILMEDRGVRYVLWHIDTYDAPSRAVLEARLARYTAYLRPLVRTSEDWLFEIVDYPDRSSPIDTPAAAGF